MARRRQSAVQKLHGGADLDSTRQHSLPAATLSEWHEAFLPVGAEGLRIRQEDLVDAQDRRMKSGICEPATENELLRERIRCMEDEKLFLRPSSWSRRATARSNASSAPSRRGSFG